MLRCQVTRNFKCQSINLTKCEKFNFNHGPKFLIVIKLRTGRMKGRVKLVDMTSLRKIRSCIHALFILNKGIRTSGKKAN